LWVLAVTTGARLGELLALRWSAVEGDEPGELGAMTIRASRRPIVRVHTAGADDTAPGGVSPTLERWEIGETKTERSRRRLHLPRIAVEALQAHRMKQAAERERAGDVWQAHDLVFCDEVGELSG
jgi:integrase